MGETAPEGQGTDLGTGQEVPPATDQTAQQQSSVNPAWNDLLGVVPSQLHSQAIPHLQKWDTNFQNKINEVHSQYEPWKKYQDGGVSPDDVDYALGLLNALSENPQEVIKALNEWAGTETPEQQGQFNQQTQQQAIDPNNDDPVLSHPKFMEMQKAVENMAQLFLHQREQEQQTQADTELENDLKELHDTHGDFDEDLVLALAAQGNEFDFAALEGAVKTVQEKTKVVRQPGPPVLGKGAAIPAEVPKPQNDAERKALVANILRQAAQDT